MDPILHSSRSSRQPVVAKVHSKTYLRRRRRLHAKEFKKCNKVFNILHSNIRGFDSKTESIKSIVSLLKPSVITINETLFQHKRTPNISGFTPYGSNRDNSSGGGIVTFVRNSDTSQCLKVFEGINDLEMVITRHAQFEIPINILNIYGKVESRSTKDEIEDRWVKVLEQIAHIEAKGEKKV